MANKHVKIWSTSYAIKESEIKTMIPLNTDLLEWLKSRTLMPPNSGEEEQKELSYIT